MRCVMLAGGGGPNAVARPEEGPPGLWGHRWWARRFERVRARGIRGVEFNWAAYHICFRILNSVGEFYFVPYFLTKGVAPLLLEDPVTLDTLHRLGCPLYLAGHVLISLMGFVLKWMLKLHDTIRDEAFLVGVQLANSELHAAEEDAHRLAITNGHPSAAPAILPAAAAAPAVAAGGAHEHAD
ncbi:hypothetical protein JKP88DRAFT_232504 [Tribonema minus]|uniref:RING-type E3 ubiquitin transferase n=1 Tax=Tribonema minus TaxID=303371 RepID=A0A836CLY3_9STRA|nr:hypothetical protein JKP88DRAFT_232504 [Tribonema minus]